MNRTTWKVVVGVVLIAAGALALTYREIEYTTEKERIDLGPLKASVEEKKAIPLPPVLSGAVVAAGVVLLVWAAMGRGAGGSSVT